MIKEKILAFKYVAGVCFLLILAAIYFSTNSYFLDKFSAINIPWVNHHQEKKIEGSVTEVIPSQNTIRVYDKNDGVVYTVTVPPKQLELTNPTSSVKLMDTVTIYTTKTPTTTETLKAGSIEKKSGAHQPGTGLLPTGADNFYSL